MDSRRALGQDMLTLAARDILKLSLGAIARHEESGIFGEAINEGAAIFGFLQIDLTDKRFAEAAAIRVAAEEWLKEQKPRFSLTHAVMMTDFLHERLRVGGILFVSKENRLIRAIGAVTGDYRFQPRDDGLDDVHRRAARWLWHDPKGLPRDAVFPTRFATAHTIY